MDWISLIGLQYTHTLSVRMSRCIFTVAALFSLSFTLSLCRLSVRSVCSYTSLKVNRKCKALFEFMQNLRQLDSSKQQKKLNNAHNFSKYFLLHAFR